MIAAESLSKAFGGRRVLRDARLSVLPGEVHALLGQNGSGKSTLIKILSGYHAPDPGARLQVRGEDVALPLRPGESRRLGLAFVHQDLGLLDSATVLENVRLGAFETTRAGRVKWDCERRRVNEALERYAPAVSADQDVSTLTEVERVMVAVVRAMDQLAHVPHGLLVLDEATASLPRDGVDTLFGTIREVARAGSGVLFVTHRLEEVPRIADRVSVLRDGAVVAVTDASALDGDDLVSLILGFEIDRLYPEAHQPGGSVTAVVEHLRAPMLYDFSVSLGRGEVVGVTGLAGMGWEMLPYVLFGAQAGTAGTMAIAGHRYDLATWSPSRAMRAGVGLIPSDRMRDGGVPEASVVENATLPTLRRHFRGGRLRKHREESHVYQLMGSYNVRPREPKSVFGTLSGGNQQKVMLAKWFETKPELFIMHEPTQGVDVGARQQIFQLISEAASRGTTVLLASAEYDDLAHLCDRVIVFRHGRAIAQLAGDQLTNERILEQCFRDTVI
ncbi:MAG TPA: sugar ABC transporter ATP-binding protein [Acidimicrobiales bacterium]|nr:sugar ABC transporter ATP-binding protein [Acidimicrobiales bacterium]